MAETGGEYTTIPDEGMVPINPPPPPDINSIKDLKLYGLIPFYSMNIVDLSPFVAKLIAYFRMSGIPYTYIPASEHVFTEPEAPKEKVPFIEFGGTIYGDSQFILEMFEELRGKDSLDTHLSAYDRAVGTAMRKMVEESMYWTSIMYPRWVDERSYETTSKLHEAWYGWEWLDIFNGVWAWNQQRIFINEAEGQGVGRHTLEEVTQLGMHELNTLSTFLGNKKFFMGDKHTTIDATMWGFLSNLLRDTDLFPHCDIRKHAKTLTNLTEYVDRMDQLLDAMALEMEEKEEKEKENSLLLIEDEELALSDPLGGLDEEELTPEQIQAREQQALLDADRKDREAAEQILQNEKGKETGEEDKKDAAKTEKENKRAKSDWGYDWE